MATLIHDLDGRAGVDAVRRPGGILAGLKRMLRRRVVYRELMSLDDRLLADIGLTRADVAAVAHLAACEPGPAGTEAGPTLARFASRIVANFRDALGRRAARAELLALDDRLLADIGLTRADIPTLFGGTARGSSLKDGIDSLVRPFRLWQCSVEAARTLNTLDDRALADVGMPRAEIGCVATELAERPLTPANSNGLKQVA